MKIVSIKLYDPQYETLRQFAKITNKNQSEIIRNALTEYFVAHKYEVSYKRYPFITKRIKIYV
ncbi:MAG: ribbon-helix-helix domain-containing protein [Nanopusillaceae archaeon]